MLGTIRPLLGSIRSRVGCRACEVYSDAESPDEVVLFEEWDTEASFINHVNSRDYMYILEWIEQSIKKPEVKVGAVTKRDGLKYIQGIRAQR
jgi:quinol monooxygenase YgiN